MNAPATASARGYLRSTLPAVYREPLVRRALDEEPVPPLVDRWLEALETVLDPVVALLDNLAAHLDPALAPDDIAHLLVRWLGFDDLDLPDAAAERRVLGRAMEVSRARGTRLGLQLVLDLAFPDLDLHVRDPGGVTESRDPDDVQPIEAPHVVVVWSTAPGAQREEAIARCVAAQCPPHVTFAVEAAGTPSP